MSEKVIDFRALRKLVRPDASLADRRLIEMRFEEEEADEAAEARHRAATMGAPPIPEAQLVYSHASQTMGVAVRGARFVCPLPKGYEGPGLELAVIPGERLIVVHPNLPALLIQPETGTTRRL
jgi:hypothetical protein